MEEAPGAHPDEDGLPTRLVLAVITLVLTVPAYVLGGGAAQLLINQAFGLWFSEVFVFLGVGWVLTRVAGRSPVDYVRMRWPGWRPFALGGALGAVNYFGMVVPLQALAVRFTPHFLKDNSPSVERIFERQSALELVITLGAVSLAAPIGEEFFFRGILQQGLATRERTLSRGIFWTAVIFSVFHQDWVGFWARVELGILFGVLFVRSGSLWAGVAAHAANNLTASVLYFLSRGQAASGDEQNLPLGQTLGLLGVGLVILLACVQWLRVHPGWLRSQAPPRSTRELTRPSFFRVAAPWLAAGSLSLALVAAIDRRGVYLNYWDLTHGYVNAPAHETAEQKAQRDAWEATRKLARSGQVPLRAYTDARAKK